MGGPSLGAQPKIAQAPSMLDPAVMYARLRERIKGTQATGRESTILNNPATAKNSARKAVSTLATPSLLGGTAY